MNKLIRAVIGAAAISVAANILLFRPFGTTGFVFSILIFVAYLLFIHAQQKFQPLISGLGVLCIVYAALAILRASEIANLLLVFGMMGVVMIAAYLLSSGKVFIRSVGEFLFVPLHLLGGYLTSVLETLSIALSTIFGVKKHSSVLGHHGVSAVLGIVVAIPILFVLTGLLSQADPVFKSTVTQVFSFLNWNTVYTRIVFTITIFGALVPWGLLKLRTSDASPLATLSSKNAVVPLIIIVGSVIGLLLVFLAIQWPYVFAHIAAEADLSRFGVATYSEYVKRGFTEFLMVAVILYSVLWMGLTGYRSHPNKEGKILLVLQTLGTGLFLLFIVSVLRRILLYWDLHGLSVIRIYGGLFLLLVSALTVTLYLRHFSRIRFIGIELASIAVFLLILGVWNQESFIIHHHPPTVNGLVDYVYLSRLSADGVEGWIQGLDFAKSTLAKNELYTKPLLDSQDRRDIAYAGYILSIFTHNYDNLIHVYGSEAERKEYQDRLVDEQLRTIVEQVSMHQNDIQVHNLKKEEYVQKMDHVQQQLSVRAVSLTPRSSWGLTQFTEGPCSDWSATFSIFNCVPSFYSIQDKQSTVTQSFWDSIFIWNASSAHAYSVLKTAVPIEALVTTQRQYLTLQGRIYDQLPAERGYSLDISLDTPLIEPIR